jgi:hypothetical protein
MASIQPASKFQEDRGIIGDPNGWTTATDEEKGPFPKEFNLHGAQTDSTFDSLNKSEIVVTDSDEEGHDWNAPAETAEDLITEVIHAEDDPKLNPWTFRMWFLGLGLSSFGGVLSTIYYFKPQTLAVSTIFLGVISYIFGELMSHLIPRWGIIGRLFNPHPVSIT